MREKGKVMRAHVLSKSMKSLMSHTVTKEKLYTFSRYEPGVTFPDFMTVNI